MTDPQLAILLRSYHYRLVSELSRLEEQLPDDMKQRREVRTFIPPNGVSVIEEFPCLDTLYAFASELEKSAENLERATA